MTSRQLLAAVAGALLAAVCVACGTASGPGQPVTTEDSVTTYDLREPPRREDLGMETGSPVVTQRFDEPTSVRLRLPEERELRTPVTLVAADSYAGAPDVGAAPPTGMDLHTTLMPLEEAAQVMRESLGQLGTSPDAVEPWVREASVAEGSEGVRSANVETRLGYLSVRLQGRYSPLDRRASVTYTLFWG